jgi:uncharacterized protein (DUF58 family)
MRVLDPAELDFGFDKAATFIDIETGRDLYVDPGLARAQYVQNFARHAAEIERVCRELGIAVHQLATSQPLELTLFDFLQSRMHGGRQSVRATNRATASAPTPAAGRAG